MTAKLDAAYRYVHAGYAVLPVHTVVDGRCSCGSAHTGEERHIGKHPVTANGLHGASSALEDVERWWLDGDWNVAVRTGSESGVFGIDPDGPEGVAELGALEAERGALPATLTYRTGRDDVSHHRVFRIPAGRVVQGRKLAPHIDTRGEGGYLILPPSVHRTGRCYEMLDSRDPVEPPDWLLDALEPEPAAEVTAVAADVEATHLPDSVRQLLDEEPGDRSAQMFRFVGRCVREGFDDAATLGAVQHHRPSVDKYASRLEKEARRALKKLRAAAQDEDDWIERVAAAARDHDNTLAGALRTFRDWLHLPDPAPLYAAIATVVANRAPGDPVWLLLVGPPGSGKTEILMAVTAEADVHVAATLTEPSLLSGSPQRERAKDAKGGLLREIGAYGIVVCKDFGSVLSMHRDARAAVLSALREVYDGSWTRHVGTDGGRRLHWEGKVGMLAGCTPTIDNHAAVMGAMGERFTLLRMPETDEEAQADRGLDHTGREGDMRSALAAAVHAVLANLGEPADARLEGAERTRLIRLATLAVRCRSAVERHSYTREIELIPEPEAPARLALTLARLLAALTTIGVDRDEAWRVVVKVALDSMPKLRRSVLERALDSDETVTTTDVAEELDHPTITVRRGLEDLTAHGLMRKVKQGKGKADLWQATDWARERWQATFSEKSFITQSER